ncbi:23S rRNA methylase [Thioflavicoccus mobilis 8321]|uniref:Ribosomal RNA large subunit methyltransferase E n=2 Tax=Thioflavicoccus mobilis TaxID=80679 RepID=L0GWY0_9GAMM|nr:23S rRNA methylase [Thioflavicoccus mobilis 8321]
MAMAKTKSSRRWLDRHFNDDYVIRAQKLGYRSRAAFKLLELQEKDRLLGRGMRVLDLGAAPGGWSQVATQLVGPRGIVVALDLLAIESLPGVVILQGDFRDEAVLAELMQALGEAPLDVVLSDMAPNISGIAAVDQPRAALLGELALDCARQVLKPGGALVVKMFQGEGFDALLGDMRGLFRSVAVRKPAASRANSRECYLVAKGFR